MRRFYLTLIGFIAGVTGLVLIAYNTNTYVAIGVMALLFANNVESAIRHEKFRKATIESLNEVRRLLNKVIKNG